MFSFALVIAAASCLTFGPADALPFRQHRFAQPSSFSFRTIHIPVQPPAFQPARLTIPATPKVSHVPIMVSVPQDFVGDSVVVTSEDLANLGTQSIVVESLPVEEPEVAAAPEETVIVDTVQEEIVEPVVQEEAIPPLSQVDDSFVLTASEPQVAEIVDVVEEAPVEIAPEIVEEPILAPEPIPEVVPQAQPIDPLQTDTFHAYNDFLNTWLQLASVNLNRPDLLNLINVVPTTAAPVPQPIPAVVEKIIEPEIIPAPVSEPIVVEPVVSEVVEPVVEEIFEPVMEEIIEPAIEELPAPEVMAEEPVMTKIEETLFEEPIMTEAPVEPIVEEIVPEAMMEATTVAPMEMELTTEESVAIIEPVQPEVVEEIMPVEPEFKPVEEPVVEPRQTVLPEITPAIIDTNTIAKSISSQSLTPQINNIHPPNTLVPIPRFTSRGRFSGYTYSFSHVPKRGTFFLHPTTG